MDSQKVDMFVMANQKYFPAEKIVFLKQKLSEADENKFMMASSIELKNPSTMLIISILLGGLGVDRFMMGDIGMGILKLLTLGACFILYFIDIFTIQKKIREMNYNNIMMAL